MECEVVAGPYEMMCRILAQPAGRWEQIICHFVFPHTTNTSVLLPVCNFFSQCHKPLLFLFSDKPPLCQNHSVSCQAMGCSRAPYIYLTLLFSNTAIECCCEAAVSKGLFLPVTSFVAINSPMSRSIKHLL